MDPDGSWGKVLTSFPGVPGVPGNPGRPRGPWKNEENSVAGPVF